VPNYSIGSAYLIRQSAGGESLGGLTLKLRRCQPGDGEINVELTDWMSGEPHPDAAELGEFADAGLDGIRSFASDNDIDLSGLNILVHRFVYHPVDSNPRVYRQAGRSALRSALEAMAMRDLS